MKNTILTITTMLLALTHIVGQNIYTYAGTGTSGYSGDGGSALNAQLYNPKGVAVDAMGNLYIADFNNHRIRKVNTAGVISTFAGTGVQGYSGDGAVAISAELNSPFGVAVDPSGNVYIVDVSNNRIRKVNPSGIISTFAGTGNAGYNGDGIAAVNADLNSPRGVAIDSSGNVYIAECYNHRIRKVNLSGIISTIAGTGSSGFYGDGGLATSAQISAPNGVTVDINGNVYIADYNNNRIRKINTSGIISTIAGTTISGYGGDGGPATSAYISGPQNIAIDAAGNIYFSETGNGRIRKINLGDTITTFAGGNGGYGGDGVPASSAGLLFPYGVAFDANGNMFIGDAGNNRIREVCMNNCLTNLTSLTIDRKRFVIAPNPNNGSFRLKIDNEKAEMILINSIGQIIYKKSLSEGDHNITINNLTKGSYNCVIFYFNGQMACSKITIE